MESYKKGNTTCTSDRKISVHSKPSLGITQSVKQPATVCTAGVLFVKGTQVFLFYVISGSHPLRFGYRSLLVWGIKRLGQADENSNPTSVRLKRVQISVCRPHHLWFGCYCLSVVLVSVNGVDIGGVMTAWIWPLVCCYLDFLSREGNKADSSGRAV